jgi:hypothetical protein
MKYIRCVVSRGQPFKHGFSDAYQVIYCNFNLVVGRKILLDIMSD